MSASWNDERRAFAKKHKRHAAAGRGVVLDQLSDGIKTASVKLGALIDTNRDLPFHRAGNGIGNNTIAHLDQKHWGFTPNNHKRSYSMSR